MSRMCKTIGKFLVFIIICSVALSGCSKNKENGVTDQSSSDETVVMSTNPPATRKVSYEDDEPSGGKKKKKKAKKKSSSNRKTTMDIKQENTKDGDMMTYMRKKCKEYGCTGSNSANFYKVLQDTAEAYGITIAQAQAAWNAG